MRPLLYVLGPYRHATGLDERIREGAIRHALSLGWMPIYAPYLLCPVLDDSNSDDRALGLSCALELLGRADAALLLPDSDPPSAGMALECDALAPMLDTIVYTRETLVDAHDWVETKARWLAAGAKATVAT